MPTIPAANRALFVLGSGVLVVSSLYFGRAILAPMALALLLCFLLSPAVDALQRAGLGNAFPSVIVVTLALALCAGLGFLLVVQAQSVVEDLPRYEDNIRRKLQVLREAQTGPFSAEAQRTLDELASELEPEDAEEPVAVTVVPDSLPFLTQLGVMVGPLARGALVVALVFFMLLDRRRLRDRIIALFGRRNLIVSTKTLDEAAQTISHYLLVQAGVQALFGLGVLAGLLLLDVPFALLWAALTAMLRFVPYLGPVVAAAMPVTLSFATSSGWTQPLLVVGLYLALEGLNDFVLEPIFYSRAAGLNSLAIIVSIAVWTLLWGPIGLFLATPLTVCLVVLGRHVPQLAPLASLLGNGPVPRQDIIYYQRLLAHDEDEALQIATEIARKEEQGTCDALLLPAVSALKADRERGGLTDDDLRRGLAATRQVLAALDPQAAPDGAPAPGPLVLGCAAADEGDVLALEMLGRLLPVGHRLHLLGPDVLVSEVQDEIARLDPAVVCIGSLAPGGLSRAILLCKRLTAASPHPRVLVGRWASTTFERDAEALQKAGADRVVPTLLEARRELQSLSHLVSA